MITQRINSKLIAADVAERLHIWSAQDWRCILRAIEAYGVDAVWQLCLEAIHVQRVHDVRSRGQLFFELLEHHRRNT
jgi:hypothetical protein